MSTDNPRTPANTPDELITPDIVPVLDESGRVVETVTAATPASPGTEAHDRHLLIQDGDVPGPAHSADGAPPSYPVRRRPAPGGAASAGSATPPGAASAGPRRRPRPGPGSAPVFTSRSAPSAPRAGSAGPVDPPVFAPHSAPSAPSAPSATPVAPAAPAAPASLFTPDSPPSAPSTGSAPSAAPITPSAGPGSAPSATSAPSVTSRSGRPNPARDLPVQAGDLPVRADEPPTPAPRTRSERSGRLATTHSPDSPDSTAIRRRSLFTEAISDRDAQASPPAEAAASQPTPGPARATSHAASAHSPEPGPAAAPTAPTSPAAAAAVPAAAAAATDTADTMPPWLRRTPVPTGERSEDDVLLDGSSVVGQLAPRTAVHWASVLVAVVLVPLAWFFLHLGAAHQTAAAARLSFAFSANGLVALLVGAACLALALWMAQRSSLGSFVIGAVSVVLGLPFLLLPGVMTSVLTPTLEHLSTHSDLGVDLATYLWHDAASGKFVSFGVFMIMVGLVSHAARRAGRREQEVIDRVRRV